ncbi:hypothetical protein B7Z28_01275, partial [Candidatus Saccharibacteria bacterium 32-45-3]
LANFPVGQGLFFAGQNHVHIQIMASPTEQALITTNPRQIQQMQAAEEARARAMQDNTIIQPEQYLEQMSNSQQTNYNEQQAERQNFQ